tara:strand:- start:28176 stop:28715 length:540 start_codon:yes stop_codon:yes gene_type:complete
MKRGVPAPFMYQDVIPLSMIRQFILLILFCMYTFGCEDTVNIIEDAKEPVHNLQINGEVQFYGEISWSTSDDSLNSKIMVENIGTDTARIETGPCAFNVIANNKNNDPVWYNRPPSNFVCFDKLITYEIAPKETKQLTDQMYISGKNWYWDIPDGQWEFIIKSRTRNGELISFGANELK